MGFQDEHVDLDHRVQVDQVERGTPLDRILDRILVQIIRSAQSGHKRRNLRVVQIRHQVRVQRGTRDAIHGARHGAANVVPDAQLLKRIDDRRDCGQDVLGNHGRRWARYARSRSANSGP